MHRNKIVCMLIFLVLLLSYSTISLADIPPTPSQPHQFWGSAKDSEGKNIPDNITVRARIVDAGDSSTAEYTTKIYDGMYGWPLDNESRIFMIESEGGDEGDIIYFYINDTDTTQTAVFVKGGATELDLTVDTYIDGDGDDDDEDDDDGGSLPGGGGNFIPPQDDNDNEVTTKLLPVAVANGPYRARINQNILFNASNSYDPDGSIINYTWNFGDGTISYEKNISYFYFSTGEFIVTLTVNDNDGLINTTTTTATIIIDSDGDGWSDDGEEYYGTNPNDIDDFPSDIDGDFIPDEYDYDDDGDGLSDEEEINLNSDPKDASDVIFIQGEFGTFIFVDITGDGKPDLYYNQIDKTNTTLCLTENENVYLVDIDNDGEWDYTYSFLSGTIVPYKKSGSGNTTFNLVYYLSIILPILVIIYSIVIYKRKKSGKPFVKGSRLKEKPIRRERKSIGSKNREIVDKKVDELIKRENYKEK